MKEKYSYLSDHRLNAIGIVANYVMDERLSDPRSRVDLKQAISRGLGLYVDGIPNGKFKDINWNESNRNWTIETIYDILSVLDTNQDTK